MYRLVALDVDGTLLDPSHTLTARTRAALLAAHKRGAIICLATGKLLASVQPLLADLGLAGAHVTCNGAALMDAASGRPLAQWPLSPTQRADALAAIRASDPEMAIAWYTTDAIFTDAPPGLLDTVLGAYHEPPLRHVAALDGSLAPPLKFLMTGGETRLLALRDALLARIGATMTVVRTTGDFVEVMAPGVSKGVALTALAKRLGVTREEIIAFGDGENDIPLLAAAGLGVAMANAMSALLASATTTARSNAEDGVADMLERLGLA